MINGSAMRKQTVTEDPLSNYIIDFELPSGNLWAIGNIVKDNSGKYKIGNEWETGAYFSKGNIEGHMAEEQYIFSEDNYANSPGTHYELLESGYFNPNYDAANQIDKRCKIPTVADFHELIDNTNQEWVVNPNDINSLEGGIKFSKKDDPSIYIILKTQGMGVPSGQIVNTSNGFYMTGESPFNFSSNNGNINNMGEVIGFQNFFGVAIRPIITK